MKLLVNTQNVLGHIVYNNKEDIAPLHETVHTELEDWVDDGLQVSFGTTIFGSEAPERLTLIARDWNDAIRQTLATRMTAVKAIGEDSFKLDTDLTHDLYLAAQEADNKFSVYGNCGILANNGCDYYTFSTIMSDGKLAQVEAKPEEWVVLTVQVD